VSAKGPRLPLFAAMALLAESDVAAFSRALELWKDRPTTCPAHGAIALMEKQVETLGEPELALRAALLLVDPSSPDVAWRKRWKAFVPHLESFLVKSGSTLKAYLRALDAGQERYAQKRIAEARAA
jgi:hypothetical protein